MHEMKMKQHALEPDEGKQITPIRVTNIDTQKELLKRSAYYLKGGVFFVSYRQLVVDLLCKKVSPSIITGICLNQAHSTHTTCESFLIKLLKQENSRAFIKWFSDQPN
jgi:hypothetical protein